MNEQDIFQILQTGTLEQVKEILKTPLKFKSGLEPLHYAVGNKDLKVIEYLISHPATNLKNLPDQKTNFLHCAARYGNLEAIQILIKNRINTDLEDEYQYKMIEILEAKNYIPLFLLAKKMLLAEKNNFEACYELAESYFSGKNIHLKKNLEFADYYIKKALSISSLTKENEELLQKLENKINEFHSKDVHPETDNAITLSEPFKNISSSYSIGYWLKSFKNIFETSSEKIENDKELLIKKINENCVIHRHHFN